MQTKKVLLLSGAHFSCDINAGSLPGLLPWLREAYSLSYQATGGVMFAFAVLSAVSQPFFGLLADRCSRPWLIPLGVFLAGAGLGCTGFVSGYWSVLACVAAAGIGAALFHPSAARFANQIAGRRKGLTLSIFSIGGNAGFVAGPLIASALVASFQMRGTLFYGLLALCTALALTLCIAGLTREKKAEEAAARSGTPPARRAPGVNNWNQFGRLTVAIISRTVILNSLQAYLPLYWMAAFHQSKAAGALAVTVLGVFGVMSNVLGGTLSDRWGQRHVLRLGFLPLAPSLVALSLLDNELLVWPLLLILGFSLYFSFSTTVVLGQQFLARNIGFASGVTLGLNTAMGGLCAPILGWIGDTWGLAVSFQVMAVLALLACLTCFFIDTSVNAENT